MFKSSLSGIIITVEAWFQNLNKDTALCWVVIIAVLANLLILSVYYSKNLNSESSKDFFKKDRRNVSQLNKIGLTWNPKFHETKPVIYYINNNSFKYIEYDFAEPNDSDLRIAFSDNKPTRKHKKYDTFKEIERTIKYIKNYVKLYDLNIVYEAYESPAEQLVPLMLAVGTDIEIIRPALEKQIPAYYLALLLKNGHNLKEVKEMVNTLPLEWIVKVYLT